MLIFGKAVRSLGITLGSVQFGHGAVIKNMDGASDEQLKNLAVPGVGIAFDCLLGCQTIAPSIHLCR